MEPSEVLDARSSSSDEVNEASLASDEPDAGAEDRGAESDPEAAITPTPSSESADASSATAEVDLAGPDHADAAGEATKGTSSSAPERSNQSFVHKHEQRLLNFLVKRLPLWVTPDILTIIGVIGMIMAGVSYHLYLHVHPAWIHLGSLGLLINWYGDSLDGHCARYRKMSRPNYGFFVDIMADLLGTSLWIIGGVGYSGLVDSTLAAIVFILFETLVVLDLFAIALAHEQHRVDAAGVSGTEVRIVVMILHAFLHAVGVEDGADILTWVLVAFMAFGGVFILWRSWTFGKMQLSRDNMRLRAKAEAARAEAARAADAV